MAVTFIRFSTCQRCCQKPLHLLSFSHHMLKGALSPPHSRDEEAALERLNSLPRWTVGRGGGQIPVQGFGGFWLCLCCFSTSALALSPGSVLWGSYMPCKPLKAFLHWCLLSKCFLRECSKALIRDTWKLIHLQPSVVCARASWRRVQIRVSFHPRQCKLQAATLV